MFHPLPARWLAVFPAMAVLAAMAQPALGEAPAAVPAAALSYKSALEGYRPFTDEKPIPWKEANETVRQRGGWQAYAKEAAGSGTAGAEPSKGQPNAPAAHQGHTMPMPPKKEQQP
ncbi:hypothetical protein [Variovorax sp. CCNWLW235]|uniref:hypothetical protein n=1 Tax=Variovorax sp. CCNWLW235 TaxID=3127463 RepID=UPI0030774A5D